MATGLATLTQQVSVAIGVPILSGVAATQVGLLSGIRVAIVFDVLLTVIVIALVWNGLRTRPEPTSGFVRPAVREGEMS